jgi:oxygen-dependent protoporphyrinogen oxidase
MPQANHQPRVAVVGGGITGLAAAHRLLELNPRPQVSLFEAGPRLGGVLETTNREGCLVEEGPDGFRADPPFGVELARRVGLESELLPTDPAQQQVFVVRQGELVPIPPGFTAITPARFWSMLTTPTLSLAGKARLACEVLVPRRRDAADESLESFATRRVGREAFERLVQPLVGGIYTADPATLSVQAALPRFFEWERQYGSLLRGARCEARFERAKQSRQARFVTPRRGMASLVEAIAARLPAGTIHLDSPVKRIDCRLPRGWSLVVGTHGTHAFEFDALVLCAPAPRAAQLIRAVDAELSSLLRQIPYSSCAMVTLAYDRSQIRHPLNGAGFVVPLVEQRNILSVSFSSNKYPNRCRDGTVLLRVFIGGACQAGLMRLGSGNLRWLAAEECTPLLGIQGPPRWAHVSRRCEALPQYHVGHRALVEQIEAQVSRWPGLALAGNAYHGVGIPFCVRSGEEAAGRVVNALKAAARAPKTCQAPEETVSCPVNTR